MMDDDAKHDELRFVAGVAEQLRYYIYALRDPRDGSIFYVGKGKGDRVYQHARHAVRFPSENDAELKLNVIRAVQRQRKRVGVEILRHGLDHATALEVEAAVIDALLLAGELTNMARGHHVDYGWQPLEAIVDRYGARPVRVRREHRVLLIRINKLYKYGMSSDDLYEATRKWWANDPEPHKPEYAFAVCYGIVRAVYKISGWERSSEHWSRPRAAFTGTPDEEMERLYLRKDVSSHFKRGHISPMVYVNC